MTAIEANRIYCMDALDFMRSVDDNCIHLTFTSPPYYNARPQDAVYNTYNQYLDFLEAVFSETHRATQEGRFLVVNTSPVIEPRVKRSMQSKRYGIPFDLHVRLVNMGWDFIDDIIWMKPEGAAVARNGGFIQHRKPLTYKPNQVTEYLMVYRKHTERLIDWNLRSYGDCTDSLIDDYESTNVWAISPRSDVLHKAVFPFALSRNVIRYYSFVGDLICDPFMGIGTTAHSARELKRHYVGCERNVDYHTRAVNDLRAPFEKRIKRSNNLSDLPMFQEMYDAEA